MCGRILLADGDESVRRMVSRVLESVGYEVCTATDGDAAIALNRQHRPDLLVLDQELIAPSAKQVTEAVRAQEPGLPIVLLNSWPNQAQLPANRKLDRHLEK